MEVGKKGTTNKSGAWYDQRRQYRQLLNAKRSTFWCSTIEADRGLPRKLWQTVNQLLGRGKLSASSTISVNDFSQFFHDKVNLVWEKTAGALEPLFSSARHEGSLSEFSAVLVSDVVAAILRLPDCSIADDLPVSLVKQIAGELGPFLTELFNRSFSHDVQGGVHYASYQEAWPRLSGHWVISTHF